MKCFLKVGFRGNYSFILTLEKCFHQIYIKTPNFSHYILVNILLNTEISLNFKTVPNQK